MAVPTKRRKHAVDFIVLLTRVPFFYYFWTLHPSICALQITVYDQEHFQGKRMEFTASCQNIMECGMDNIRSLKVECGA